MPDKRLSAVKRIQKAGVVFQSDRIRDYKLPEWIQTHVSANKRRIAPRTAQILAEYLGNDLKKIAGEMEKLGVWRVTESSGKRHFRVARRRIGW